MNPKLKLLLNSFFYGSMIGGMLCWLYTIGIAKQQDWIVVMDFNMYGEGMIEYLVMFAWLIVAIYKAVEYFRVHHNSNIGTENGNKIRI